MLPRIYLFLILGIVPVCGQAALNNDDKMNPDQAPKVVPYHPPGAVIMQPGVTAPGPGAPLVLPTLPGEPPVIVKVVSFTIHPGTIRQSLMSRYVIGTAIKLNVPATKDIVCHVISSDLIKLVATDIPIIKGHDYGYGGLQINWTAIKHDCKIEFKAYDADRPDEVFTGRIYLKKFDVAAPPPKP